MKLRVMLLLIVLFVSAAAALPAPQDESLAANLVAYQLGFLRRGPVTTPRTQEELQKLQAAHMDHIKHMAETGKLVAAGPFLDGGELRGIFLFACSAEEARRLAEADPAVKAARLALDLYMWWGPKGIGEAYAAAKKANLEMQDEMVTYHMALLLRGPNWMDHPTPEMQEVRAKHFAYIRQRLDSKKMIAAGPFENDGDLRGIFIFPTASMEEARALTEADPAVKAGRLRFEIHPWMTARGVFP